MADRQSGGTLVTEIPESDLDRPVTVYVPAGPAEAIVYAGDGQRVGRWGRLLESADLAPTMVAGVHGLSDETARLHEYSPGFDEDRFEAHEHFLVDDVRGWLQERFEVDLPAARTAIFGASAAGELALALGLRHPDVFGTVLSASPGAGYRPPDPLPAPLPRVYLVAGTQEPFFLDNANRWAAALKAAGADVVMQEREGSHGNELWRAEFARMVAWAFGPRPA